MAKLTEAEQHAANAKLAQDIQDAEDLNAGADVHKKTNAANEQKATQLITQIESSPRIKHRHDVKPFVEANNHWSVAVQNATPDIVLNSPSLLWLAHDKLRRFDMVTFHDELHTWEVTARVMKIDKELQVVLVSALGPPVKHAINAANIDYDQIKIEERGAVGKWSLIYGKSVLSSGHETKELAQKWLSRKRAA